MHQNITYPKINVCNFLELVVWQRSANKSTLFLAQKIPQATIVNCDIGYSDTLLELCR